MAVYFLAQGSDMMMTPDRQRRYTRVRLAQELHVSPLEIDRLSQQDITDIFAVMEGQRKAAEAKK